jgi:hypothetical protein
MKMKPLAVAVGAALPIAAFAATITAPTNPKVSTEYLAVNGAVAPNAGSVALGAQYALGDVLTFTFSHPPKAGTATNAFSFPTTLTVAVTGTGVAGTVAKFDQGDNSVSYRVTTAPTAHGADFGTITLPSGINFRAADIGTTDVTLSTSASTAQGLAFDAGAAKKYVDVTGSQFAATISGLTQVIDVESARKKFAVGTTTATSHTISVTPSSSVGSPNFFVAAGTIGITLDGDFSWLDSNTATNATGIQTANIDGTGVTVSTAGATRITLALPATGGTISLANSLGLVIPTQTLSAAATLTTTASTTVTASATASGAYTLNGSSVTVYAVPTSSSVSNFIWLTNTGSSRGDVSITVYDGSETYDLGVVGSSAGGTQFDVTAALNDALAAEGVTLSGGRVHMDIVTTAPAADIAVSAAYRVGDDRVNLLTSIETDQD